MLPLFLQGRFGSNVSEMPFPIYETANSRKNKQTDLQFSVNKVSFTAPTV